jgi:hypothetical protein
MRTRLFACAVGLALLAAACGGGDGGDQARSTSSPGGQAPELDATPPADVKAAADGEVNRPTEGTYLYAFESETTNASTPTAPPRTSAPGAERTSKVSYDGDVVVTQDKIVGAPAIATVRHRWTDDGIAELEFATKTERGDAGCEFDEPFVILEFPLKEGKLPKQDFTDGTGANCNATRTIEVVGQEDATDAAGRRWPTWRVEFETVVKSTGLTLRTRDTRWLSPELGKEITIKGVSEYINPSGGVSARATSEMTLKSYPKA